MNGLPALLRRAIVDRVTFYVAPSAAGSRFIIDRKASDGHFANRITNHCFQWPFLLGDGKRSNTPNAPVGLGQTRIPFQECKTDKQSKHRTTVIATLRVDGASMGLEAIPERSFRVRY